MVESKNKTSINLCRQKRGLHLRNPDPVSQTVMGDLTDKNQLNLNDVWKMICTVNSKTRD